MMPDHIHLIWMRILESTDQKLAMRHLRTRFNDSLSQIGYELQDQPYDHVLKEDERQEDAMMATCEYIARNPERAGLVAVDGYAEHPYSGCLVPGYPEMKPFESDYWTRFNRSVSYLRKNGPVVGFARIPNQDSGDETERVPSHSAHAHAPRRRGGDWFLNCRLRLCLPPLNSLAQDALYPGNSMDGGARDVHGRRDVGRQRWTTDQVCQ